MYFAKFKPAEWGKNVSMNRNPLLYLIAKVEALGVNILVSKFRVLTTTDFRDFQCPKTTIYVLRFYANSSTRIRLLVKAGCYTYFYK